MTTATRVTLATIKAFIRKNRAALHIRRESQFDGMTDGVEYNKGAQFHPIVETTDNGSNCGIAGVWFVGGSRNHFSNVLEEGWTGYHVYNCCGSFTLAIKTGE